MAGIYHRLGVGTRGSADLMAYITRPPATGGALDALLSRRVPASVPRCPEYGEMRASLVEWARQRSEEESVWPRSGAGRTRVFYWVTLSHHAAVPGAIALAMAAEYLAAGFPNSPAVAALHLDTAHVHTHLWIDARQADGRKIAITPATFAHLTATWGNIYGRQHGREIVREHERRIAETREWRREYAAARRDGRSRRPPPRATCGGSASDSRSASGGGMATKRELEAINERLQEEVVDLQQENARLTARLERLSARLERLTDWIERSAAYIAARTENE